MLLCVNRLSVSMIAGVKGPDGDTGSTGVQGDTGHVHLGQFVCLLFIEETTLTLVYLHLFMPCCEAEFYRGTWGELLQSSENPPQRSFVQVYSSMKIPVIAVIKRAAVTQVQG